MVADAAIARLMTSCALVAGADGCGGFRRSELSASADHTDERLRGAVRGQFPGESFSSTWRALAANGFEP
jgi:hypothetical protein